MVDRNKEAAVRARAYQLWEESGRADGSQDAHWRQAEREIAERGEEETGTDAGAAAPAASRPPAQADRHSDGMSPHPSVLDPGPGR